MKRVIFFLLVALTAQSVNAQSVGIGTTIPNASAKLDISSTTQGLLIPRMNIGQRISIVNPATGLMVYDTDIKEFWYYDGTAWQRLLNGNYDYWNKSSSRNWVYNSSDSIGLGTSSPTEKLDVHGNIRVTGDLLSSGEMTMNNATGTIQMQNAGVNKAFVQLSGNNLRMGTNSGNTTGNMVIRMNGNDRVTINPAGDIDLDGKITTPNTGTVNMLPLCFGNISSNGTIQSGSGNFTVTKIGTGIYEIHCAGITTNAVILAMSQMSTRYAAGDFGGTGIAEIATIFFADGTPLDTPFYFIIYKI